MAKEIIIERDVSTIGKENMLEYSVAVIEGRAVPDVRDGLKPVQRRVLWGMVQNNWTSDKSHKKSALIVGIIMGKYHPHGDSSIYDAMVRMTQWFRNNIPLVDPNGNFGSHKGDSAAAMRYTEARMSKFAGIELVKDIKKNAVDMVPNYLRDDMEPIVLPSRIPLLLINGVMGIAAGGYASEIPSHNPIDVGNMVIRLIDNPETTVDEIARDLVPDFPTGGILCSSQAIVDAYKTGRGNVRYRAKIEHERVKKRDALVVTELPFGLTIGSVMDNIVEQARPTKDKPNPNLQGIHDIRNESRKGVMRLVIELRNDADPGVVENLLYQYTTLQITQKIILTVTGPDNDEGYIKDIKYLFTAWIDFRRETIRRIALYDIAGYKRRIHIIEGLLKALADIDHVIKIIKGSKDNAEAKGKLIVKYKMSTIQADAILDMKLSRLTALETDKLNAEKDELEVKANNLREFIHNPELIDGQIKDEQKEIIEKYKKNFLVRKTQVIDIDTNITQEDIIDDEQYLITVSHKKYIKRVKHEFTSQKRGGKGTSTGRVKDDDFIEKIFYANSKDHLLVFTNTGRVFDLKVWQVDEAKITGVGSSIGKYFKLAEGESVKAIINISNQQYENNEGFLMFATKNGLVKKTSMAEFQNIRESGIIATKIKDGDELLDVGYIESQLSQDIFLATKTGIAIRFSHADVSPALRPTFGMKGIDIRDGDEVISFDLINSENDYVLAINSAGLGKRTLIHENFPVQQRGGKGRIAMALKDKHTLVKTMIVNDEENIIIASTEKAVNVAASDFNIQLRPSYGHRIINLGAKSRVVDISKIVSEEEII